MTLRPATLARLRARLGATSRRTRIVAVFVALFSVAVVVGFHPDVQKKLALRFAGPLLGRLAFRRLRILPWSVSLERFTAG